MTPHVESPGTRTFVCKPDAVKFAQDRVSEGWITHLRPATVYTKRGIVFDETKDGNWIVRWWCQ